MDYENMILERQENNYEGLNEVDDIIEVRELNTVTGKYETLKTYKGQSAIEYMEIHGIY